MTDLVKTRRLVALGKVESAAVPIFAAARRRESYPNTFFLWHEPYSTPDEGSTWRATDHEIYAKTLVTWYEWACDLLAWRTKRTATHWRRIGKGGGTEFDADQALRWGLVDHLIRH